MVVLCNQNIWLLVAAERFNTITNSSCVGVGSSPAGRCARRKQESGATDHKPPKVYTENLVNDTYVGSSTVPHLGVSSRHCAAAILISFPLPIPLAKDQECAMP
ncbi:hypothetical protein K443DRAFT_466884 [Laccaria amethystina LaAM-08-1]|uniref:Uncharacterized protein n=1 Tax=Laccaria amethystina LaAM-08-1 TaxID=1095629 RepID=A0A0C9WHW7_9AGAR|nr:hypothetical protein K443DRAFT_466884 [Laccaria amethystina LaAM-08-1]